jgi:hypothetical protein
MGFDFGRFLGDTYRTVGHVVVTGVLAPLEVSSAVLNGVGDLTGVQGFKKAGEVTNVVPQAFHTVVDHTPDFLQDTAVKIIKDPVDATPIVGTIVRSGQATATGVQALIETNPYKKYELQKRQRGELGDATLNAAGDVIGAVTAGVGKGTVVLGSAGARALATRGARLAAARVVVTEASENAARDATTAAIAAAGRDATNRTVMELAAPSLVGTVEREGAQIGAHNAVMETENATVVAATKATQAAVAANLAAKASAAKAARSLERSLAKQAVVRETEAAAARELAQKNVVLRLAERNPWKSPLDQLLMVAPGGRDWGLTGLTYTRDGPDPERIEPHTRPNDGKSDRQDPTLNDGIESELLFRDALLAPGDQLMSSGSVVYDGNIVDTSYNLLYAVPLLLAAIMLVSEIRV